MTRKIFKRVGVRRDRNLSDLSNTKDGLNNLLDTLIDETGNTFISEDLDAIRNIYAEGLTSTDYQQFVGSRVQKSTSTGGTQDFIPPITYQNRLDKFEHFAGTPRIYGGNGLTAKYFNKTEIDIGTVGIWTGAPFDQDKRWEAGNFAWTGKITPASDDSNGGIEWEGYFIPIRTSKYTFYYSTTACFTFDFQTEGYTSGINTYTEQFRVGTDPVNIGSKVAFGSTFTTSSGGTGNSITLATTDNHKRVAIGQTAFGGNIVANSTVYNVSSNGTITLKHPDVDEPDAGTPAVTGSWSNANTTFHSDTGVTTRKTHNTYVLEAYKPYALKFRYFIPKWRDSGSTWADIDAETTERTATFDVSRIGTDAGNLLFYELYSRDYDFSDSAKGDFPIFVDNSVLFGGTTTSGIGNASDSSKYVKVKSTKKIDVKYTAPTSLSAITKASYNCTTTNGTPIVDISGDNTWGIEVGNYVFGSSTVPDGARVQDIIINDFIVLDRNCTGSGTNNLTFIDHRGFVKRVEGSTSGGTLTITSGNTTDLKSDMMMVCNGGTQWTGITTTGSSNTVNISPSQTHSSRDIYFYESKGLRNDSLIQFCQPPVAKCLALSGNFASGSTVLDISGSIPTGTDGWVIRGFQFSSGTTISINNPSTGKITLSNPTINELLSGESMSIAPSAQGDRTLCCPPVDTSPPFTPTEEGLETTSSFPNMKVNVGDISFDELNVLSTGINVTDYTAGDTSNRYIELHAPGGTFKILATT